MAQVFRDRLAFLSGVFLLCMSALMIQIIQTRILSVVSLYYLAFFSISMAMLGLAAGALIAYSKLDKVNPRNVCSFLSRISTAFVLSTAACFVLQLASPLVNVKLVTFGVVWLKSILLLATPLVFGGIAVSLALTRSSFAVGITYGVDLVGVAVCYRFVAAGNLVAIGTLLLVVLLSTVVVVFVILLPARSSVHMVMSSPAGKMTTTLVRARRGSAAATRDEWVSLSSRLA